MFTRLGSARQSDIDCTGKMERGVAAKNTTIIERPLIFFRRGDVHARPLLDLCVVCMVWEGCSECEELGTMQSTEHSLFALCALFLGMTRSRLGLSPPDP